MTSQHSAQEVGTMFVKQYYTVLHLFPDQLHRFYDPSSKVGSKVAHNILPIGGGGTTDIETIDAQSTFDDHDGVIVAVSGYLVSPDRLLKRKFAQTFFLARGAPNYYVHKDIFTYEDTRVIRPVAEPIAAATIVKGNAQTKTFASVVKELRENTAPLSVPAGKQPTPLAPSKPKLPAVSSKVGENKHQEVEGHSIVLKNLPFDTTLEQLEVEFKRFGPVKPNGIYVKSNREHGFCFAFLEFKARSSVERAIEAPPLKIGGRRIFIEEKRPLDVRGHGSISGRSNGKEDFNKGGSGRGSNLEHRDDARVNSSSSYRGSGKFRSNAPRKASS